jgi:hypothetical protein
MTTAIVVIVIVAAVIVLAAIAVAVSRRRRSQQLQQRFGTEYQHVVTDTGSRRDAEQELESREKRRSELDIRPLDREARDDYAASWEEIQAAFVDSPSDAVGRADRLVHQVMSHRGYPVDDFEQRAADISVDHADVVSDYRAAHDISLRNDAGEASTEDLRLAMVHYRSLFSDLLVVETTRTTH